MSGKPARQMLPSVRSVEIDVDRASSRLLRRGLEHLRHRSSVDLPVVALYVTSRYIFIASDDWDADYGRSANPHTEPQDLINVWRRRYVILYRFSRDGVYLETVKRHLAPIDESEHAHIRWRVADQLHVREHYIHFSERFSSPRGTIPRVTLHYIFNMTGELVATWRTSDLLRMSQLGYPTSSFDPKWFLSDRVFGLDSRDDIVERMYRQGASVSHESLSRQRELLEKQTRIHTVSWIRVDYWIGLSPETLPQSRPVHIDPWIESSEILIPVNNFMVAADYVAAWDQISTSDGSRAWFVSCQWGSGYDLDIIWTLCFDRRGVRVVVFGVPDFDELIHQGSFQSSKEWMAPGQQPLAHYISFGNSLVMHSRWPQILSSGNLLLLDYNDVYLEDDDGNVVDEDDRRYRVLFDLIDDRLVPREAMRIEEQHVFLDMHDEHLYFINRSDDPSKVMIRNINDQTETFFHATVMMESGKASQA